MNVRKSVYTHGHHETVLRSHSWRTAANSAAYLLPHLRQGLSVVDIGAGPGTITADLAARVTPGRVTAVETSESALDLAHATSGSRGLTNVDFRVGDVHRLELPADNYDVVHAHQVLQHVTDPVQALREMRRVARPGGVVAARDADYRAFAWYPALPELDEWMALYQRLARANGGEPDAGRRLLAWASAAGFREIEATATTWCFANPEDRAWWGGMWADRVLQSDLARQARAGGVPEEDLRRISAGWRAWAEAPDGWFAVPHGEILAVA